ncbi:hypothetical protein HYALB_00004279 [Hymenoscyphus albidus]|uniref:PI-PLC Y-box domain-containing protein n=1 Tax=Hymenoscyphus albidus TaxID=595503 RepID=A0A9N9LJK1_9HELO|nr:hypothetical protein HYALB_00004279 [Hymenoscyphus albidus]
MGPLMILGYLVGGWITTHLLIFLYNLYLHPLRNIPGSRIAAISELYTSYLLITGEYCRRTLELHDKYGPVIRTGPRELSFNTLTAFNEIYGGRLRTDHVYEKNPIAYIQGTHESKNIFFAQSKAHGRYRKILAPAFSESSVREVEPTIKYQVDGFIRALRDRRNGQGNFPTKDGVVDIDAWATYIVFDLLSALSFGEPFGCVEKGEEHPWVTNIFGVITHATWVQAAYRLKPYHKILEKLFIPEWLEGKFTRHLDWTKKTLKKRIENPSTKKDWLTFYEKGLDEEELFDSFNVLIAAGGETTASTIAATLYYSTHTPGVMEKLVKEVRGRFASDSEIDIAEAKKLALVRAVIDETMRIHPAVPVGLPRIVPKGGRFIDGHFVPGGSWVSASQMSACLSPMNFFEPRKFHPERWLGDKRFENDNRGVFFPFSLGKRNCIGLHVLAAVLMTMEQFRNCSYHIYSHEIDLEFRHRINARKQGSFDLE